MYSLKNVKVMHGLSDETWCFSASVYKDGKNVGTVSNDGQGGSNMYSPWSLCTEIDEYAKTLPTISFADGMVLEQDESIIIGELVNEYLWRKEVSRSARIGIAFVIEGDNEQNAWRTVKCATERREAAAAHIREKYADKNPRIFNGVAFA